MLDLQSKSKKFLKELTATGTRYILTTDHGSLILNNQSPVESFYTLLDLYNNIKSMSKEALVLRTVTTNMGRTYPLIYLIKIGSNIPYSSTYAEDLITSKLG
jgi:hypothetical protein